MKYDTLDMCCGGRMWWYDKADSGTVYCDRRTESKGVTPFRPNWHVAPDVLADFRHLPFRSGSFRLVVFDPPHIPRRTLTGNTLVHYGVLHPDTWRNDIRQGFREAWRVLAIGGTLVFKWAGATSEVKPLFPVLPMVGTRIVRSSSKQQGTAWFVFHKRLPSTDEFVGSDPDFTGQLSTEDYMTYLRGDDE